MSTNPTTFEVVGTLTRLDSEVQIYTDGKVLTFEVNHSLACTASSLEGQPVRAVGVRLDGGCRLLRLCPKDEPRPSIAESAKLTKQRWRRALELLALTLLLTGCGQVRPDEPVREAGRDFFEALAEYAVEYGKAYACREMPTIASALNLCEGS